MPAASEWPVGLLLDEVWLRARRSLVVALENAGVWPRGEEQGAFVSEQRTKGEALRDAVLMRHLADEDRRWLASPALFAAANRRFRSRVPMALAFGHELSVGLQALDRHETDAAVAQACAIFNFGISVFDLLHDTHPQLSSRFASYFNRDVLLRLHSDPAAPSEVRESARAAKEPELRLLLQVIATFYELLRGMGAVKTSAYETVTSLLSAAYEAEMRSATCDGVAMSERLGISHDKSSLPFAIIDAIGALRPEPNATATLHEALISDIGTIFWLTDDLADLVGDARSGSLNAILIEATGGEALDVGESLRRLLDGRAIEDAATNVRDAIVRVHEPGSAALARVVTSYVRMWLE